MKRITKWSKTYTEPHIMRAEYYHILKLTKRFKKRYGQISLSMLIKEIAEL